MTKARQSKESMQRSAKQEAMEMIHKFRKVGCASTPEAELRSAKQSAYMHIVGVRKVWEEVSACDYLIQPLMNERVRNKIIYYQEVEEQILSIPG